MIAGLFTTSPCFFKPDTTSIAFEDSVSFGLLDGGGVKVGQHGTMALPQGRRKLKSMDGNQQNHISLNIIDMRGIPLSPSPSAPPPPL